MVQKITELTNEQQAMMPVWRDQWIKKGLQTGDADFDTFATNIEICYDEAEIPFPGLIVKVGSPPVGAFVAAIAERLYRAGIVVGDAYSPEQIAEAVKRIISNTAEKSLGKDSPLLAEIERGTLEAVRCPGASASESSLPKALEDVTKGSELEWQAWLGGQFWVGGWWGSPAFVSFFTDVCDLELEPHIARRALAYRRVCESVNYVWPNRNFVIVCDRPQEIHLNDEGRLSSNAGFAISYKGGWGLHALDGAVLPSDLWQDIVSGKMTLTELMQIENADHRAIALKYNAQALMDEPVRLLHTSPKGDELYELRDSQLNEYAEKDVIHLLRMTCPTGRTFVEFASPEAADAFKMADELQAAAFGVPAEYYRRIVNHG